MATQNEFISNPDHIKTCARCGLRYDWRRSPSSSLKMTYCGSLCESAALGFTIESLLRAERAPRLVEVEALPIVTGQPLALPLAA